MPKFSSNSSLLTIGFLLIALEIILADWVARFNGEQYICEIFLSPSAFAISSACLIPFFVRLELILPWNFPVPRFRGVWPCLIIYSLIESYIQRQQLKY